jgi:O-antigen ligase
VVDIRPEVALDEPAPPWWEQAIVVVIITLLTGALVGPIFAPTQEETPILRLMWLPVYGATLGLVLLRLDRLWRIWPAALILLLMVIHAYASKYWSIDPGVTTRRTIAFAMSSLFALYLGARFRGPHLPRIMMIACLLMGVASLIMVFANPAIGVHQYENAGLWRGIWYEKNQMGLVMVSGVIAAAACLATSDNHRLSWSMILAWATVGACTLLVLATQSKTSLLCLILGVGVVAGFWAMRRGGAAFTVVCIWLGVVIGALILYLVITEPAVILKALGKDPSLTGRTDIWTALMRKVAEKPWTGFGYQAFWGRTSIPAEWIRRETQWPVPSAHNGWIDLLVQLGWPGAISVGATMLLVFFVLVARVGGAGAREGYFCLAYFIVFLLLSLSESVLMTNANLPWTLLMAALARCFLPDPQPSTRHSPAALDHSGAHRYLTRSRIAANYGHGQFRRPLPVRRRARA